MQYRIRKPDKLTLSGLSPVREAAKTTTLGKALPFSTWLRIAGYEPYWADHGDLPGGQKGE